MHTEFLWTSVVEKWSLGKSEHGRGESFLITMSSVVLLLVYWIFWILFWSKTLLCNYQHCTQHKINVFFVATDCDSSKYYITDRMLLTLKTQNVYGKQS